MGRARTTGRGSVSIGRGRSIDVPDDIQPILTEAGANPGNVQELEQQISNLQSRVNGLESTVSNLRSERDSLANQVNSLQTELNNSVSIGEAEDAVRQAFQQGARAVISYLQQQGIL